MDHFHAQLSPMLQRAMRQIPNHLPQYSNSKSHLSNIPQYYNPTSTTTTLFEKQSTLSKLPIPSIDATLSKYIKSLEPLATPSQLQRTIKIANEFKNDPIAKTLQNRLVERSKDPTGWLAEYWNNYAYLEWRDACAGNVNFFYHFKDDNRPQSLRAAVLTREMIGFRQLITSHSLSPEYNGDSPLCSHMYNYLFNTTRIPVKPRDQIAVYNGTNSNNSHVIVLYKQHIFSINTIINDVLLSTHEIKQQIDFILNNTHDLGVGLGALTSWHRDNWSDAYQLLAQQQGNADALHQLQSAAFVLCLDDHSPVTLEECATTFLYGNVKNRWFDKSCQLIVCQNGKAGMNNEHSMMDGTINTRLADTILTNAALHHDPGTNTKQLIPNPKELTFNIHDTVLANISEAVAAFDKWTAPHNISVLAYYGHGKSFIKSMKCSPDAYLQMALQLAYYKLHHEVCATYESATLRQYIYSRTETCRSCSNESKAFVMGMQQSLSFKEKAQLLRVIISTLI